MEHSKWRLTTKSALRNSTSPCCPTPRKPRASALESPSWSAGGKCRNWQHVGDACRIQRQLREDQKQGRQPLGGNRPLQPADVEACRTQHRMQRVTTAAAQPAATHAVVALGVTNGRLDRLAPPEPFALLRIQRFGLAQVDDLQLRPADGPRSPASGLRRSTSVEIAAAGQKFDRASVKMRRTGSSPTGSSYIGGCHHG